MSRIVAAIAFVAASGLAAANAVEWKAGMNPNSIVGSFHQTCNACKVDQYGYLSCSCKTELQIPIQSLLRLQYCSNTRGVENISGNLQCAPIIRGSWGASCSDAYVRGRTLYYSCANGRGGTSFQSQATFDLDTCPSLRFENIGSVLRCMK